MRVQFSHRWNAYEYTRWSSIYFFYRIKEFFRFFDIYFSCKFCVILSFDYFDLTLISSLEMSSKKKKLCQTVINLLTYFKLSFSLGPIWEIFSIFFSLSFSIYYYLPLSWLLFEIEEKHPHKIYYSNFLYQFMHNIFGFVLFCVYVASA